MTDLSGLQNALKANNKKKCSLPIAQHCSALSHMHYAVLSLCRHKRGFIPHNLLMKK